jgi:hypothetical protein
MASAELRPSLDPSFNDENTFIASQLGVVDTFRVGGEYRIDNVSLRGGYRFEGSPYLDGVTIGDLESYSLGLGINFGGNRLDVAFNRSEQDVNKQLFDTAFPTAALINRVNTNVSVGYTMNF